MTQIRAGDESPNLRITLCKVSRTPAFFIFEMLWVYVTLWIFIIRSHKNSSKLFWNDIMLMLHPLNLQTIMSEGWGRGYQWLSCPWASVAYRFAHAWSIYTAAPTAEPPSPLWSMGVWCNIPLRLTLVSSGYKKCLSLVLYEEKPILHTTVLCWSYKWLNIPHWWRSELYWTTEKKSIEIHTENHWYLFFGTCKMMVWPNCPN